MTDAAMCDRCQINEAFYYTGGVYTCATCALQEIKSNHPKGHREPRLPKAIKD